MVRICRFSRAIFLVALLFECHLTGVAQVEPATRSEASTIVRDPRAIALIQSALAAAGIKDTDSISDFVVGGAVTLWDGQEISAPLTYKGIGDDHRSLEVKAPGSEARNFVVQADRGSATSGDGSLRSIPSEIAIEGANYFFIPLLTHALVDLGIEIRYLTNPYLSNGLEEISVTRRLPTWRPELGKLASVTHYIYFDQNDHLVTRIVSGTPLPSDLNKTIPHVLVFSDYRPEHGWLIPHHVDEAYVGKVRNRINLTTFQFNSGLTSSDFSLR